MAEQEKPKTNEEEEIGKKLSNEDLKTEIQNFVTDSEKYYQEWYEPKWDYLRNRYLGIRDKAEDAEEWRSNMTMNKGFGIVTGEAATGINSIYSDNSFFALRDKTGENEKSVRAIEKLLLAQKPNMKIYTKFYQCLIDTLTFGTGWIKFTMETKEIKKTKYDLSTGKVMKKMKVKTVKLPCLDVKSNYDIYIDEDLDDIDKMERLVEREFICIDDIKEKKIYNGVDKSEFLAQRKHAEMEGEEQEDKIECYTYWTEDEVATVTDTNHLIRRQANVFGRIPFRPMVKYPEARKIYGIGSIEAVADIIDFIDDLMNTTADNMLLSMMKAFLIKSSSDVNEDDMKLYPGKFIRVKNFDEVQKLDLGGVGFDWVNGTKAMDGYINQAIGNLDMVDAPSTQTATESRLIASRSSSRFKAFGKYNKDNFVLWFIQTWIEYNFMFLEPEEMLEIVGKKDADILALTKKDFEKWEDVDYKILITGDDGLEDKTDTLQNIQQAVAMITQVQTIDPSMPVDRDVLIKHILTSTGVPEGAFTGSPMEAKDAQINKDKLQGEVKAKADQLGVTPEALIEKLSSQLGVTPEQFLADAIKNGGFNNFLAQIEQGVKDKGGSNAQGTGNSGQVR